MLNSMKKTTKKLAVAAALAISIGCFAGCSSSKQPKVNDIASKIESSIDKSNMKQADSKKLQKLYNINEADLEEFVAYSPSTNLKANEIAILKVKDASKVEEVKKNIEDRLKKQSDSFKDYLPNEYYLIEKHVLKTKDNYILLAISKDSEKIEASFDEAFK